MYRPNQTNTTDNSFFSPVLHTNFSAHYIGTEKIWTALFLFFAVLYCGKKAEIAVGNVIPLREMPEGTVICNVEHKVGDRGSLARCSGDYATVIGHSDDKSMTYIRLPSGIKKTVQSGYVILFMLFAI